MSDSKKRLLVLDDGAVLPPVIRESVERSFDLTTVRSADDLLEKMSAGDWHGVLIGLAPTPPASLMLASHVKRARPELVVILLGALRTPELINEAFRAHVDAVVDAADWAGLDIALASRLGLPTAAA